jgi:hypothetical protein
VEREAEKRIRCPACERLFPMSQLGRHEMECPEMARLDEEVSERGGSLRK